MVPRECVNNLNEQKKKILGHNEWKAQALKNKKFNDCHSLLCFFFIHLGILFPFNEIL